MIRDKRFTPSRIIVFLILTFFTVTFLSGIIIMVVNSVKSDTQYYSAGSYFTFPSPFMISNYWDAFSVLKESEFDLGFMIFNSAWYSLGTVILHVFTNNVVAYILARYSFPGRKVVYWTYFFTMMLPIVGAMPSTLKMYQMLHIDNSPLILVARIMAGGSSLFVFYSAYKGVAKTYSEAAFIDGAGHFKVFFSIMFPQTIGVTIALSVTSFISVWNDYLTPLVYFRSWPTLASGLYQLSVIASRNYLHPYLYAGIVISSIPIIILFIFFQKTLLQINISGGIKG